MIGRSILGCLAALCVAGAMGVAARPARACDNAVLPEVDPRLKAIARAACHRFTGAAWPGAGEPASPAPPPAAASPPQPGAGDRPPPADPPAVALAPDLRHARDRFRPDALLRWLVDPRSLKPDALMPAVPLTDPEARDLAAYVMTTPLAPPPDPPVPPRLPLLDRRVTYDEVSRRVLRRTCWHCHSEPDYALGDGGPGNTGGFGFPPRGLNLASYEGISSGRLDDTGARESVFAPMPDGTPRLLATLLARRDEEQGRPRDDLRGMPLGLPALPPEDIQLVETWIAEGRPR
jgi:hypothetical protein